MSKRKWEEAIKEHRYGRFTVDRFLLEQKPTIVAKIMSHLIVVRCEALFAEDALEYTAISPLFDKKGEGLISPRYIFTIDNSNPKKTAFQVHREAEEAQ